MAKTPEPMTKAPDNENTTNATSRFKKAWEAVKGEFLNIIHQNHHKEGDEKENDNRPKGP